MGYIGTFILAIAVALAFGFGLELARGVSDKAKQGTSGLVLSLIEKLKEVFNVRKPKS